MSNQNTCMHAGAVAINRDVGSGNKRLVYRYYCSGSEASLQSCVKFTYTIDSANNWYNRVRAAVECQRHNVNISSEKL